MREFQRAVLEEQIQEHLNELGDQLAKIKAYAAADKVDYRLLRDVNGNYITTPILLAMSQLTLASVMLSQDS